jgi:hypothetical protein
MANQLAAARYAYLWQPAEDKYAIPRGLGAGLIDHETGGTWNPKAVRNEPQIDDASRGLTQLLLRTARSMGFTGAADELFDAATNIDLGFKYLAHVYGIAGNWPAALSAYNGGYRPALGFGAVLAAPRIVILAHDSSTGEVSQTRTAAAGEFANQPYVDDTLKRAAAFGAAGLTTAGLSSWGWLLLAGVGAAVAWGLLHK